MWEWLKSWFDKAVKVFKMLYKAALPLARQIIMGQLAEFALDVVKSLDGTDLSNEDKRKEAFGKIKGHAIENSIEAKDSLVNALIELSVLSFKTEF